MGLAPTLPTELWLVIFDLVIEATISLVEQCGPTSFPDIDAYLRSPKDHPLVDDTYRQLRLVCRNFHASLGTSPHFFMKSTETSIPTTAKALYITESLNYEACFKHLLAEPSRSHRIIKLDVICDFWMHESPETSLFRTLCENSGSLPNLRSLDLRLFLCPLEQSTCFFWTRLNIAFPLLTCLTISLDIRYDAGLLIDVHPGCAITFRNLKILDLDNQMYLHFGLHLPSLRHIALGNFFLRDGVILARSPLLESVLLRRIGHGTRIDLRSLPKLQLLGVPMWEERIIDPIDAVHPLEHLWIYMKPFPPSQYRVAITQIPRRLPAVSRITLDIPLADRAYGVQLKKALHKMDLRSSGLIVQPNLGDGSRIVLERTWMYGPPRVFAEPGAGEKHGILGGDFKEDPLLVTYIFNSDGSTLPVSMRPDLAKVN